MLHHSNNSPLQSSPCSSSRSPGVSRLCTCLWCRVRTCVGGPGVVVACLPTAASTMCDCVNTNATLPLFFLLLLLLRAQSVHSSGRRHGGPVSGLLFSLQHVYRRFPPGERREQVKFDILLKQVSLSVWHPTSNVESNSK